MHNPNAQPMGSRHADARRHAFELTIVEIGGREFHPLRSEGSDLAANSEGGICPRP